MDNEPFTLEAIVAMQHPLRDCHCTTLSFEGCELDDLHIQVLSSSIAENVTIKSLNLSRNAITDNGASVRICSYFFLFFFGYLSFEPAKKKKKTNKKTKQTNNLFKLY